MQTMEQTVFECGINVYYPLKMLNSNLGPSLNGGAAQPHVTEKRHIKSSHPKSPVALNYGSLDSFVL